VREPKEIWIQLQAPDERNLAGVIARGVYRHTDSLVRVYDTDGNLLGVNEKGRRFSSGGLEPRIIMSIPIKTS